MTAAIESRKTGPKPTRRQCGRCQGAGTIPVDPGNRRKGEQQCPTCVGVGELCLPQDCWTARQAAARLGIPYTGVLALINTGQLGWVKAGKYKLVPQVEIDRWIERKTQRGILGGGA